jgi:hypothetical protein
MNSIICALKVFKWLLNFFSSSGSTVLYGPWPPQWSSHRYCYHVLSSTMFLLSMTLHILRHYQATLIWVFPFFLEPSGCEKIIFLQGEFSSTVTKCPSHLNLAIFITLTISRSLYEAYAESKFRSRTGHAGDVSGVRLWGDVSGAEKVTRNTLSVLILCL